MDDKRFMVTHSLLNSWSYALKENPFEDMTSERDPMADFMSTLRREPITPNQAMQNGIDFEDLVTAITKGGGDTGHRWYEAARTVATHIQGAQLQHRANRTIRVGDKDIFLYGRIDALVRSRPYQPRRNLRRFAFSFSEGVNPRDQTQ